eukprot:gnl/TRDRNA2_/TRDRNA2_134833_c0_seq1.p1 gnl/TRDRNA2_/TRDRNA2_134833_c0~~gnl/TRDRNA2_/TRDRNA2_134833_c0_seq1.p1  ORF type:complete len:485 (+),score=72.96 gnl/TRDRNA2_/TRDRNA2_134833_c0_seq1:210-1457(+)
MEDAEEVGERVPCPLDPNHTVFVKRLEQHLKICSKKRDDLVVAQQPFYRKGANAGDGAQSQVPVEPIGAASPEMQQAWADRIEAAFSRAVSETLGAAMDPEELLQMSVVAEATEIKHSEKHEVQNAALAQLVTKCGLADNGAVIVEYGCGKGGLAAAVLGAHPGARCVLVDRETRRHKLENKQDRRDEQVLRLRLDIVDFDLAAFLAAPISMEARPKAADFQREALSVMSVLASTAADGKERRGPAERLEELWRAASELQASPWPPPRLLACAKHLCGGATDIALRSLRDRGSAEVAVCVATCCHHRCDATSYINMPFLRSIGLCDTAEEFAQFVSTAGWGVGGQGGARDLPKRRLGMMSKRILDMGRMVWLRDTLGLEDARLADYISKDVTPENIAIVAGSRRHEPVTASGAQL